MQAWRRLCHWSFAIVNKIVFHSNSHINQMLPQIIPILRFCLVGSMPQVL